MLPPNPNPNLNDLAEHDNLTKRSQRAAANAIAPIDLTDEQVGQLIDFLHALTDPSSLDLRHVIPRDVPSGLPVFD